MGQRSAIASLSLALPSGRRPLADISNVKQVSSKRSKTRSPVEDDEVLFCAETVESVEDIRLVETSEQERSLETYFDEMYVNMRRSEVEKHSVSPLKVDRNVKKLALKFAQMIAHLFKLPTKTLFLSWSLVERILVKDMDENDIKFAAAISVYIACKFEHGDPDSCTLPFPFSESSILECLPYVTVSEVRKSQELVDLIVSDQGNGNQSYDLSQFPSLFSNIF